MYLINNKNNIIKTDGKIEGYREATQEEVSLYFELPLQKSNLINVRLQYLKNTDWYIAREIDQPNTYPQEIKDKRILARQEINEIESATQEIINNYSTIF